MEVGKRVRVSNHNQINYPLEGVVVESDEQCGIPMSKVKFRHVEVWYADEDLTEIPNPKTGSHPRESGF